MEAITPHIKMVQRAILYTRVSSDQQVNNTSLGDQERIGREYCQSNDIELLKVFREEGESAKYIDRTELTKSIAYCADKSNKVDLFLVYKMDRFSRSLENHLKIRSLLKGYGVRLVSMTENIEDTPTGELMENILASFAQFDNQIKRERVMNGMIAKIKQGVWVWRCPTGYVRKDKIVMRDEERFDLLQEAWMWYSSGRYSQMAVADKLNSYNFKSLKGTEANISMVNKMFKNPFYMGRIVAPNFNLDVEGIHEKMVDQQTFYRVQDIMEGKENRFVLPSNGSFVLNRLLICGGCGRSLSGSISVGKLGNRYGYYCCSSSACANKERVRQDYIEDWFMDKLSLLSLSPQDTEDLRELVLQKLDNIAKTQHKKIINIETQITNLRKEIEYLGNKLDIGFYTNEEALTRKKDIERRIIELEIQREKSSIQSYKVEDLIDHGLRILQHLLDAWKALDPQDKTAFAKFVFPVGIKIEKKQPSNPQINPLFVEIGTLRGGVLPVGDPTGSILQHLYDLFTSLPGLVSVIPSSFINIQTL